MRRSILSLGAPSNNHLLGANAYRDQALEGNGAPLVAFDSPDGTTDGERPTEPRVPKLLHSFVALSR